MAETLARQETRRDSDQLHNERCSRADVGLAAVAFSARATCGSRLGDETSRSKRMGRSDRANSGRGIVASARAVERAARCFYPASLVAVAHRRWGTCRLH